MKIRGIRLVAAALMMMTCGAAARAAEGGGKVLFDFEDGKAAGFEGGTVVDVDSGKHGLRVEKGGHTILFKPQDWGGFDLLKIDVVNPGEQAVKVLIEVRDAQTKEYWTRVNYTTVAGPGKSTLSMPTDMYVGEKSRPGRPMIKEKVTAVAIAALDGALVIDDIRLEKNETAGVLFEGLKAFDFGIKSSPVMPGFKGVIPGDTYAKDRGYGLKAPNGFDGMQPDALYQDFVLPESFQVDLPDGSYHALMNIDCPGGYWGEVQYYTQRKVTVNGKTVVDEKMDAEAFKKRYFRYAHHEDLPGVNAFKEYVEPMFSVKEFDFEVTGGKAEFQFSGSGRWPVALSSLVIYPGGKSAEGKKFWTWVTAQRERQFNEYFKQVVSKAEGAKAPANGFTVFARHYMTPPGAFDGPRDGETIAAEGLSATVAQGEEAAVCFSVQPGSDLGKIDVKVSDLKFEGGPVSGDPIQAGWLDFRVSRVSMDGTAYKVAPRYWHSGAAPAAKGVTRTFWLRVQMSDKFHTGHYTANITVKPESGPAKQIPLKLTVLPFALDEIKDVAAGPWGCTIGLPWDEGVAAKSWDKEMLDKSLAAIRAAGCTTATGIPHVGVKAANGKISLDFKRADEEMKTLRAHGFEQMVNNYGSGMAYPMYGTKDGADENFARKAGFQTMEAFLRELYGNIEQHAAAEHWLPVAWNLCDEPLGDAAKASARNAALHTKVATDLGLKYSVFTGATSMQGNDPKNVHYDLVSALQMPSLNLHDDVSIRMIQEQGHKFSFYNGGNRWTYGRYMKALVVKYSLAYRTSWHYNVVAGDPYYALDCREDDYCWYNTDENQTMVPSLTLLAEIQPGLNDYRYLTTLERLVREAGDTPSAAAAKKIYDRQLSLVAGKDRGMPSPAQLDEDRREVIAAILSLKK